MPGEFARIGKLTRVHQVHASGGRVKLICQQAHLLPIPFHDGLRHEQVLIMPDCAIIQALIGHVQCSNLRRRSLKGVTRETVIACALKIIAVVHAARAQTVPLAYLMTTNLARTHESRRYRVNVAANQTQSTKAHSRA